LQKWVLPIALYNTLLLHSVLPVVVAGFEPAKLCNSANYAEASAPSFDHLDIPHAVLPKSILSRQLPTQLPIVNYIDFRAPLYIIILPLGYLLYLFNYIDFALPSL